MPTAVMFLLLFAFLLVVMEVTRRQRRRRKLLDDLKDRRGYFHLKEEALIALCGGRVLEEAWTCHQTEY